MGLSNLYLHFLDRELRNSVGWHASEKGILEAILAGLCLAPGRLYCGYSHLWESHSLFADSLGLLRELASGGIIVPTSSHPTADEFLASRIILYKHDTKRYPVYFRPGLARKFAQIQPAHVISTSPTKRLVEVLGIWVQTPLDASLERARQAISKGLNERAQEAVTGTMFGPHAENKETISIVRRVISSEYTKHYMQECAADILTGIPGLTIYDSLAQSFPFYDSHLFRVLLASANSVLHDEASIRHAIEGTAAETNNSLQAQFLALWGHFIKGTHMGAASVTNASSARPMMQGLLLGELKRISGIIRLRHSGKFSLERLVHFLEVIKPLDLGYKKRSMPPHQFNLQKRLREVEELLEIEYDKFHDFRKEIAVATGNEKIMLKQRLKRELVPKLVGLEREYGELLSTGVTAEEIPEAEANIILAEVVGAVTEAERKNVAPPEMARLLTDIKEKINEPGKSVSAKLKVSLPIIPLLASYEMEMDTEGLLVNVWRKARDLFKGLIDSHPQH